MIGKLVHDFALGRNGIVVGGTFTDNDPDLTDGPYDWEWLVLYDGGELLGADTMDLKEIE